MSQKQGVGCTIEFSASTKMMWRLLGAGNTMFGKSKAVIAAILNCRI